MGLRGIKRDKKIIVLVNPTSKLYYQFITKDLAAAVGISQSDLQVLGHIELGGTGDNAVQAPSGSIVLLRCNSPKPPRVSLTLTSESTRKTVNTFCAVDKIKAAIAAGWSVRDQGLVPSVGLTPKSVVTAVKLSNGLLYITDLLIGDYDSFAPPLGLLDPKEINAEAERAKLIRGTSNNKPGRAIKVFTDGTKATQFYSYDAPLDDGWRAISKEVVS